MFLNIYSTSKILLSALISAINLLLSMVTDFTVLVAVKDYTGFAQAQSSKTVALVGLLPLIILKGILKSSVDPSV